ncbi:MAG: restriction endonuclease subunit M [Planctomycetes bacterium]|nr:restriction endonuclease subunit M [Planctomycetota bacterium]
MHNIDVLENTLRHKGALLDVLLLDCTTKKNIIWSTESYEKLGKGFGAKMRILPDLVTGKFGLLIQPRAAKSLEEQRRRTKDKAEVFTPLKIIKQINKAVENQLRDKNNWQEYVKELKLEITCGEAPFIVSRYDSTAHTGKIIPINKRVGFLDGKLKIISKYCHKKDEWLFWAQEAFKASYGYEWQGDNVLLARENLLYTFIDYYKAKFKQSPNTSVQKEFAEIISWNIFQMDGLRYVVPMSCHHEIKVIPVVWTLFGEIPATVEKHECEGCKYNRPNKHNGKYVKIMDWSKNKTVRFVDLSLRREEFN